MAQAGERRFTFRLYGDSPADAELLGKLDRLLADGRFRSRNDVLRKGIALAYEACYGASGVGRVSAGLTGDEIREASRMMAEEVVRQMGGSMSGGSRSDGVPEGTEKMTDEMASFLSGLNTGG